jgi:methylmalonyl-CoA mutase cobalamin-binding domain/chain
MEILEELMDSVVIGDVVKAREIAQHVIKRGISVNEAIEALVKAMKVVDERYEKKEYFVIDVASAASAMRESFKVLEPHLETESRVVKGKIVIGSLKDNVQGLGKDIVAATLQSAGFQVFNLGVDVAPEDFVKKAIEESAQVIAISISMEETIPVLQEIVDLLRRKKLRDQIKVVIGGNAVSEEIRGKYALDAYAIDARDCVEKIETLLG